ncbi:MAG TPA: response regulator [Actinomycetota bacterium]|nr:response regulator [Actinomycetota bacterium]
MPSASSNGTVLVVDDDLGVRDVLCEVLLQAGYRPISVSSAEEGIQAFEASPTDCILLDVQLPGLSGYEACLRFRELAGEDLPILFLSGVKIESLDRAAGLLMGADDYISKPVAVDELLARIHRLLRKTNREAVLTKRECEVLRLVQDGLQQNEIAAALFISPKTVASHMENIFKKLRVGSRESALAAATAQHLLA